MTDIAKLLELEKCPIGLFKAKGGEICLKTEYSNDEGRIDAYIVSSGEFFWGEQPQTIASQRKQLVEPFDIDALLSELAALKARVDGDAKTLELALAYVKLLPFYLERDDETEMAIDVDRFLQANGVEASGFESPTPPAKDEMTEIYQNLAAAQKPLGAEFSKALSENMSELYEPAKDQSHD